ncbi:hypothetical protein Dimus_011633 [Dionaea muscipula]
MEINRVQRELNGEQTGVVVGQEAQESGPVNEDGRASTFYPRLQNGSARKIPASQENITRLCMQGRLLGNPLIDASMAATGVRAGRGASFKMKRKGVLVRVAAAAATLAGSQTDRMAQRDLELLKEARSTWDLGKTLGIEADALDVEAIQRILQLDFRDAPGKERREGGLSMQEPVSEVTCCGALPDDSLIREGICLEEDKRSDFVVLLAGKAHEVGDLEESGERARDDEDCGSGRLDLAGVEDVVDCSPG